MKPLLAFVILALMTSSGTGQVKQTDNTVFGNHLGEKFSVPECARLKLGKSYVYKESDTVPCFERVLIRGELPREINPVLNDTVMILFPLNQSPKIISGRKITALVIDSNLEGVGFSTLGLQTQDQTLEALRDKYGDPTSITELKKQNAFGASFDSHFAVWTFTNITVVFHGTTDRVDSGLVTADTKKGADFRSEASKKSQSVPF
jgi:hypothetical protein